MTAQRNSLDRLLVAALEADGPDAIPAGFLDGPIATALTAAQRRPRVRALDARAWPFRSVALPGLGGTPMPRALLLIALLSLATAAALVVGSRLFETLRPPPALPRSISQGGQLPPGVGSMVAVALPDGRIVVAGYGSSRTLAGIFDPRSGATLTIPAPGDVGVTYAGLLPDGRVALYGALVGVGGVPGRASVWLLDPKDLRAVQTPDALAIPNGATVTLMPDGSLLLRTRGDGIAAPVEQLTVDRFDPRTGTLQSLPWTAPPLSASGTVATALDDGRILLVDDLGVTSGPNADVRIYDPRSGIEAVVGRIHQDRYGQYAAPVQLLDGRWLIVGGEAEFRSGGDGRDPVDAYIFDPAANTLTQVADLPHSVATATALPDGRVVLTGSWVDLGGSGARITDSWIGIYDPLTETTIESLDPISQSGDLGLDVARDVQASVLLPSGSVALIELDDVTRSTSIEIFSPGSR